MTKNICLKSTTNTHLKTVKKKKKLETLPHNQEQGYFLSSWLLSYLEILVNEVGH